MNNNDTWRPPANIPQHAAALMNDLRPVVHVLRPEQLLQQYANNNNNQQLLRNHPQPNNGNNSLASASTSRSLANAVGAGAATTATTVTTVAENGISQNECFTAWEPLQLRQEWTISNFRRALVLATPGTCMRSKNFRDESMPEICWQLCLYPGGKREENAHHVSLFLKMSTTQSQREFTVRAEYHFYFLDEQGKPKFSNVNTGDFKVKPSKGSHSWGLRNIPKTKVTQCIRPDDSLHIVCQIELVPDFSKMQSHGFRNRRFDPAQLNRDYLERIHQMFLSGTCSDCVIECGAQQFAVHKFVLMAHSEVFRAMFSHKETVESVESRIRIADCTPTAVHQMLTYMYSGGLPDNFDNDNAQGLIEISEKYGLDPLKIICQDKLISRLNLSNVCVMLMIADTHNADMLMSACIPLVRSHIRQLLQSPEWAEMKSTNPSLVNSVLEKVVTYETNSVIPPPLKRLRLQEIFCRPAV